MDLEHKLTIALFLFGAIVIPYLVWNHKRVDKVERQGDKNDMSISALKSDFEKMETLHAKTPERLAVLENEVRNIGNTVLRTTKEVKTQMARMEVHILRFVGQGKLASRISQEMDDYDATGTDDEN